MKKVIISGFGPFLGHQTNPSELVCQAVDQIRLPGVSLKGIVLPVTYRVGAQKLIAEIQAHNPDCVISLGLASDRSQIEIEKVALNFRNAKSPDAQGVLAFDEVIDPLLPESFMTSLPYLKFLSEFEAAKIPARLSLSAGSYVCNEVFFRLMSIARTRKMSAGFIHLPDHSEQDFLSILPKLIGTLESA